jgi:hypothetical protein
MIVECTLCIDSVFPDSNHSENSFIQLLPGTDRSSRVIHPECLCGFWLHSLHTLYPTEVIL